MCAHYNGGNDERLKPSGRSSMGSSMEQGHPLLQAKGAIMDGYAFEWAGLEMGFKECAIFYPQKNQLHDFLEFIKEKGYSYSVSEFAYHMNEGFAQRVPGPIDETSQLSLYVSKGEEACKELKKLDHIHQWQLFHETGSDSHEVFSKISKLLGYPPCCSAFVQNVHRDPEYSDDIELRKKGLIDEDTLYPMAALRNSSKVLHLLNNFSLESMRLIPFSVCDYSCKHAHALAKSTLDHLKENHRDTNSIEEALKTSLIFFSPHETIYLPHAVEVGGLISYSACRILQTQSQRAPQLGSLQAMFAEGNCCRIDDSTIGIFKNDVLLHTIRKKHRYNGIFIHFD